MPLDVEVWERGERDYAAVLAWILENASSDVSDE